MVAMWRGTQALPPGKRIRRSSTYVFCGRGPIFAWDLRFGWFVGALRTPAFPPCHSRQGRGRKRWWHSHRDLALPFGQPQPVGTAKGRPPNTWGGFPRCQKARLLTWHGVCPTIFHDRKTARAVIGSSARPTPLAGILLASGCQARLASSLGNYRSRTTACWRNWTTTMPLACSSRDP